jgi:hypothetical protein
MGLGDEGEGSYTSVTAQVYSRFDFVLAGRGSRTSERGVVLQVVDRKGVARENKFASMVTGF